MSTSMTSFIQLLNTRLTAYVTTTFNKSTDAMEEFALPIIRIDVGKFKAAGYISQRDIDYSLWLMITGALTKTGYEDGDTSNTWTLTDQCTLVDFAEGVVNNVYAIHDDKQSGIFECPGFIQLGEYPEVWVDLEIVPHQMRFGFQLEAKFLLKDVEV